MSITNIDLGLLGSCWISLESGNMRCCSHFTDILSLIKNKKTSSNLHDSSSWLQHVLITCVEAQDTDISRSRRKVLGQPRVCCVVAWS